LEFKGMELDEDENLEDDTNTKTFYEDESSRQNRLGVEIPDYFPNFQDLILTSYEILNIKIDKLSNDVKELTELLEKKYNKTNEEQGVMDTQV
ncbi:unnamed protein product, partial [Citrullus colocynthis]